MFQQARIRESIQKVVCKFVYNVIDGFASAINDYMFINIIKLERGLTSVVIIEIESIATVVVTFTIITILTEGLKVKIKCYDN